MSRTIIALLGGQLLVALACAFGLADEPRLAAEAPQAKKIAAVEQADANNADVPAADAKQADVKKVAVKKKAAAKNGEARKQNAAEAEPKQKVKAPAGYEDAPQARVKVVRAANAAKFENIERLLNAMDDAADADDVGEGFDKLLAAEVDANVVNLEKQFVPQFTLLLTSELSFIHRVCDLNLEQRQKIKAASDRCLAGAARKYAMTQRGMARRRVAGQPQIPDPTDLLHQALGKVLEETLRPEQQIAYEGEMAKRAAYRRQVAIEMVVSIIDERLVLTTEQRREISASLDKHWQPIWVQSIEMLVNSTQNLPSIPDQFVVPFLNQTQQRVWRTTPKQTYAAFGSFGMGQQVGAVEDFPLQEADTDVQRKPSD